MAKYKHMDLEETLGNLYPDLANEWCFERNEALTSFQVIPGSAKQVWWKCSKCQYQWQAAVYARVKGQKSCMHCKSLAANYPDLTEEWCYKLNGEKSPFDVYPGSINSVWWECKDCHHRWEASIGHRVKGLKGCSNCKTLAIVNPSLAQEWCYELNKGLTPNDVTTRTSREVWWKCKDCNNRWKARIVSRTDGLDCQVCK